METKFKEIFKLRDMLEHANIPFCFRDFGGYWAGSTKEPVEHYQIEYPGNGGDRVCSIIEGDMSLGNEFDRLEIMGLLSPDESRDDTVVGYLTAENVFGRIWAHASKQGWTIESTVEPNEQGNAPTLEEILGISQ